MTTTGLSSHQHTPAPVAGIENVGGFRELVGHKFHFCARKGSGEVFC